MVTASKVSTYKKSKSNNQKMWASEHEVKVQLQRKRLV